jgi:aspartate carbamoyltransferase catalytic subunit
MEHVLTSEQFDHPQLETLFAQADQFRALATDPVERRELASRHVGKQLCSLFYEPSTRTRLSFETAAVKFGMGLVSTENAKEFSSAAKGETLEDTVRVLDEYDYAAIVMRHHETGAAARAAAVSHTPIINGGDGKGEHPTQALLDAHTIHRQFGKLSGLHIVMGGDLANGRTVRSLSRLLSKYPDNRFSFVSIPELQIGEDVKVALRENETPYEETVDMYDALRSADVVYWTRLQKERLENPEALPEGGFTLDSTALQVLPEHSIIMHPLPRTGEIDPSVDSDPRAQYFKQAGNGLYVRMALIDQIISGEENPVPFLRAA